MTAQFAEVRPTRRFFIDTLTADIQLEDAILDLVDNAVDALTRSRQIDLSENLLLSSEGFDDKAEVSINVSEREIKVHDNCGGVGKDDALGIVFRIGRVIPAAGASLGVYGIGLKRAIFKIGNAFSFESRTVDAGFVASLENIDVWASDDSPEWKLPVQDIQPAGSTQTAGTTLRMWKLRDPIRRRIKEGTLLASLKSRISRTYPLFLGRFVRIFLNGKEVAATPLPIGESDRVESGVDRLTIKHPPVEVTLLAGVASRKGDEWNAVDAGWYVVCNGRVVVSADKSELTGWGTKFLPQFHSKYRAFVGIALFFSEEPHALPWTTTKRGINSDSIVFQQAQPRMSAVARPVLAFINRWYPGEVEEQPAEREVATSVSRQDVRGLARQNVRPFKADVERAPASRKAIKIQFDASHEEIERARRAIGKGWSGARIGRYAFEYYLKNECDND